MTHRILLVDDDPNILKAYERRLRKLFDIETALCSEEGITAVNILGPFAVVVSDMNMPRENGAQFLHKLLELAPDTVRIMLTGNADQQTASDAINYSRVFRFLTKPCSTEDLAAAIREGIQEYQRRNVEREVLSETLTGAVDMLAKVLSMVNPAAFGRGARVRHLVKQIAAQLGMSDAWEIEVAALLAQVGYLGLPPAVFDKVAQGQPLTAQETQLLSDHPRLGAELIGQVPRLRGVAEIVAAQHVPTDNAPLGAEILDLALDFDNYLEDAYQHWADAFERFERSGHDYDPDCVKALHRVVKQYDRRTVLYAPICELQEGMQLLEDIETIDGALLIRRGEAVTPTLQSQLAKYAASHSIVEPIRVLSSLEQPTPADSASH